MRYLLSFWLFLAMLSGVVEASYSPSFVGSVAKLRRIDELEHCIEHYGVDRYQYWSFLIKESGGDRWHVSSKGAREVGQVMPDTRRNMEIQKRAETGNRSYEMSWVEAGVRYYWVLCDMFPTLEERAAAYNCGDARLRGIKRRHGRHWRGHLPTETARYVRAITANYRLLQSQGTEIEAEAAKLSWEQIRSGDGWYHLRQRTGASVFSLQAYNLHAKIFGLKAHDWVVYCETECRLPEPIYVQCEVDGQRENCCQHTVQMGDTLWDIAQMYGAKVRAIQRANNLGRRTRIHPGQLLAIPVTADSAFAEHVVRRGDNPWRISRRYGVDLGQLLLDNQLTDTSRIYPGQVLKIREPEAKPDQPVSPDITYRIRRGDNLFKIARRFNTTVSELKRLNGLNGSGIQAGATLVIASADWYEVRSGDTLGEIAQKHGTTIRQIQRDNGLRSTRIKVGQKLRIRE